MNYRCSNMENEIFRDDLMSRITQEYNKLLGKVEELLRNNPARSEYLHIDTVFLRADGQFGQFKFINMCVPDSFLIALFICYMKYDCIASLFNSFEKLRAPMVFLRDRMYNEAKASWLFGGYECSTFKVTNDRSNNEKYVIDVWSEPKDHLHMFNELVLPKYDSSLFAKQMSEKTLSKFKDFGDVHGLGFSDPHPLLVLVDTHQLDTAPPLYVDDADCNRTFELQFLLLTRVSSLTHAIAVLNIFDRWVLYDDLKTLYDDFNPKCADFKEDFSILLAGYVNITQEQERDAVPLGVSEEGYQGTVPFNSSHGYNDYEKEHID